MPPRILEESATPQTQLLRGDGRDVSEVTNYDLQFSDKLADPNIFNAPDRWKFMEEKSSSGEEVVDSASDEDDGSDAGENGDIEGGSVSGGDFESESSGGGERRGVIPVTCT